MPTWVKNAIDAWMQASAVTKDFLFRTVHRGELEQIQLLLGHSSVQTTERYRGTKQGLTHAPSDWIKLMLV